MKWGPVISGSVWGNLDLDGQHNNSLIMTVCGVRSERAQDKRIDSSTSRNGCRTGVDCGVG